MLQHLLPGETGYVTVMKIMKFAWYCKLMDTLVDKMRNLAISGNGRMPVKLEKYV